MSDTIDKQKIHMKWNKHVIMQGDACDYQAMTGQLLWDHK